MATIVDNNGNGIVGVTAPQIGAAAFNPAGTSTSHDRMKDRLWELDVVWGGTESLRDAGESMLPRFEAENLDGYRRRLSATRLRRNMFRQAVERTAGRLFEVPVKVTDAEEGSTAWSLVVDNADLRGNSFDRVARDVAIGALRRGMHHVLVDYPVVNATNLAEERAAGARPYVVQLNPGQILECYEDDLGNTTYLRWYDQQLDWDPIARAVVLTQRVHERRPGEYTTWRQVSEASKVGTAMIPGRMRQSWEVESEGRIAQAKIMFHTIYAEREDHLVARTPLTEVKDLTAEHWEIGSDLKNCLRRVLFPILTVVGLDQKEVGVLELGPESILGSTNKDAKFSYLEHTGAAIKSGEGYLEALEHAAEVYAGQLSKPTGDVKATQTAISTAETSSWVKDFGLTLQDRLQAIVDDMALWAPAIGAPRVVVNLDFAVDLPDGDLTELGAMRRNGDLDQRNYWVEMGRRNVLRSDFNPDEAEAALETEQADSMKREADMMRTLSAAGGNDNPADPTNQPPGA